MVVSRVAIKVETNVYSVCWRGEYGPNCVNAGDVTVTATMIAATARQRNIARLGRSTCWNEAMMEE